MKFNSLDTATIALMRLIAKDIELGGYIEIECTNKTILHGQDQPQKVINLSHQSIVYTETVQKYVKESTLSHSCT